MDDEKNLQDADASTVSDAADAKVGADTEANAADADKTLIAAQIASPEPAAEGPADTRVSPATQVASEGKPAGSSRPSLRFVRGVAAAAATVLVAAVVLLGVGYGGGWLGAPEQEQPEAVQEQDEPEASTEEEEPEASEQEQLAEGASEEAPEKDAADTVDVADEDPAEPASEPAPQDDPSDSASSSQAAASPSEPEAPSAPAASEPEPAPAPTPAPSEPEPEPAPAPAPAPEPATITVHVSIDSSRAASYGYASSMGSGSVTLKQGATVYDALLAMGVSVSGSSSYVRSIGGLSEFDCGDGGGWMYAVNGTYPSVGCGSYTLSGGESILWVYTLDLGNDL